MKVFWIIILVLVIGGLLSFLQEMANRGFMAPPLTSGSIMNNNINVSQPGEFSVTPIEHATMVVNWGGKVIYTDPVGGSVAFTGQPEPDLVLLTDIHSDHLNVETLQAVVKDKTVVVLPRAVADEIKVTLPGKRVVLRNGEAATQQGFLIEAVPMYNFPESPSAYHTKGRGNGYVVEANVDGERKRIYISGDTGNIPEARALRNIDHAFIAMNLPYTMSVEDAAQMVLAFKPARVTPYHYRGQSGFSDIENFRTLVNDRDDAIEVDLMDFYPAP